MDCKGLYVLELKSPLNLVGSGGMLYGGGGDIERFRKVHSAQLVE